MAVRRLQGGLPIGISPLTAVFSGREENLGNAGGRCSSDCRLASDAHAGGPQGAGQGVEWLMGAFDNEAAHGFRVSQIEFHDFASFRVCFTAFNGVFLYSPSGDNSLDVPQIGFRDRRCRVALFDDPHAHAPSGRSDSAVTHRPFPSDDRPRTA